MIRKLSFEFNTDEPAALKRDHQFFRKWFTQIGHLRIRVERSGRLWMP